MRISKKTRDVSKHLQAVPPKPGYLFGLALDVVDSSLLRTMGFDSEPKTGDTILPPAKGPASRRNAHGYVIIRRDQPMETAWRQVEWHWKEWRGRDQSEEMSAIRDVPYKRYPRTAIAPYGVELTVRERADGKKFLVAGPFQDAEADRARATNSANMLIEQLGEFEIFGDDLTEWIKAPIRKLNWELLPPGDNPWESAKPALEGIVLSARPGNRGVVRSRLDAVGEFGPEYVAIGRGGFAGYVAFCFPTRGLCVLESPTVNNATYVLPLDSWEKLSQLSKAQILTERAHLARVIHRRNWFDALNSAFGGTDRRTAA